MRFLPLKGGKVTVCHSSSRRRMTQQKTVLIALISLVIIAGIGYTVVLPWLQNRTVPVTVMETIKRPELNFAFTFPSGEDAYSYFEPQFEQATSGGPQAGFILLHGDDYETYQADGFVGEAPPSMSIFVYDEGEEILPQGATSTEGIDRYTKIRLWAEAHTGLTSYSLMQGEAEEVVLDGAKALHYITDGLYRQDVYVVFHSNRFYVITGQYDGEEDPQYQAFQDLIKSLLFL